mgnify:FL=1
MISITDAWVFSTSVLWLFIATCWVKRDGFIPGAVFTLAMGLSGLAVLWLR